MLEQHDQVNNEIDSGPSQTYKNDKLKKTEIQVNNVNVMFQR